MTGDAATAMDSDGGTGMEGDEGAGSGDAAAEPRPGDGGTDADARAWDRGTAEPDDVRPAAGEPTARTADSDHAHRVPGAIALDLSPRFYPAAEPGIPPGLARVRAFVNTREISAAIETEGLATPADLGAWLAAQDLVEPGTPVDAADLRDAIRFREALRELLLGNAGHAVGPWAVEALRDAGARAPVAVTFSPDGAPALEPLAPGVRAAFARLLADIAVAVADGTWPRLKACRNDECRWAYFDASRNRSGRWCSMAGCGNRMKGRAYRDRTRGTLATRDWTD